MRYLLLLLLISSFVSAGCIDINSASLDELDEIIWVGPATAEKIVENRPYGSLDDITKINGIGDSKLEDIASQGLACVGEEEMGEAEPEKIALQEEKVVLQEEKAEVISIKKESEVISLNSNSVSDDELVYVSKDRKIIDWLPYGFALFLIFIIGILSWERF